MANGSAGAGVFSLAGRATGSMSGAVKQVVVAVGGDYQKSTDGSGTAAFTLDGKTWAASAAPPHGYRSAVVFVSAM